MRTRRAISINNSLVHGICNYNCKLCGVNKPSYQGPRGYQERNVTQALINRIKEAAAQGIHVRYVANAGDGEATIHPDFAPRMDMYGQMLREWDCASVPPPEISVVSNGQRLAHPGVLEAMARNDISLLVSFPTSNPAHYGEIMMCRAERGGALLDQVVPGIEKAMRLAASGRLPSLGFHISPPDREHVRADFPETVMFLSKLASRTGLRKLRLLMFPSTSNRTGLVQHVTGGVDLYQDLFRRFNGSRIGDVRVEMLHAYKRFYPSVRDLIDLIMRFDAPCIWNGNLFITSEGDSCCCNDQRVKEPMGSILNQSIRELMETKENRLPGPICQTCDQAPHRMRGSLSVQVYRCCAGLKTWMRTRMAAQVNPTVPDAINCSS